MEPPSIRSYCGLVPIGLFVDSLYFQFRALETGVAKIILSGGLKWRALEQASAAIVEQEIWIHGGYLNHSNRFYMKKKID